MLCRRVRWNHEDQAQVVIESEDLGFCLRLDSENLQIILPKAFSDSACSVCSFLYSWAFSFKKSSNAEESFCLLSPSV